jgi:tRNA(Ile)-lysidine synthase
MNDAEAVRRFAGDFAALAPEGAGPIAVAVSGGPDSLALLLLAHAAFPGRVKAATVDHQLRAESGAEAAFVSETCRTLGIPHHILRAHVMLAGQGVQAAARDARYAALAHWMADGGIQFLLTGHHADDQAETLLMRLNRGAGVGGLAGIRPRTPLPAAGPDAAVLRPLLGWRRTELAGIVAEAGVDAVDDSSNVDPAYDRSRLRAQLRGAAWIDSAALARSAAALWESEDALAFTADRLFEERVRREGESMVLDPQELPPELLRRLVFRLIAASPRGEQVTALLAALKAGETRTLCGWKCRGGAIWRFEPAPPRRTRRVEEPRRARPRG